MSGIPYAGAAMVAVLALTTNDNGALKEQTAQRSRLFGRPARGALSQPLEAFLDWWAWNGPHDVLVAPNGGVRLVESVQEQFAATGQSNARTLASTPHGRGGAVDLWPVEFEAMANRLRWDQVPAETRDRFRIQGEAGEAFGLRWGGRWASATFPNGDQPHIEDPNWQALPFPYRGVA